MYRNHYEVILLLRMKSKCFSNSRLLNFHHYIMFRFVQRNYSSGLSICFFWKRSLYQLNCMSFFFNKKKVDCSGLYHFKSLVFVILFYKPASLFNFSSSSSTFGSEEPEEPPALLLSPSNPFNFLSSSSTSLDASNAAN